MAFDIGFIKAKTHTPEYLMHKYWARKPHNVINECIAALTTLGDTIIDPFCGSGVTMREGALLGRNCIGYDLNPVAVLISSVLINPPKANEFVNSFEKIYDEVYAELGYLYQTEDDKNIKYLSHRIIAKCTCGSVLKQGGCNKKGKKFFCPRCGSVVRFNLEKLVDTEVLNITVQNDRNYTPSESELIRQKAYSEFSCEKANTSAYDFDFPENRRILAFNGIKTSSFFTKRNYSILSYFADFIWEIENETIRNCALLLLTSSAAQCSRLIASRNNLSTGGPAWSVPGFWVPQEHLETNPFVHFKARLSKFKKAIEALTAHPTITKARIVRGNSLDILKSAGAASLKADLIFLDPPYGDSVPYTEFSNIWNSFLKNIPSSDDDISVSDRIEKIESWRKYNESLDKYMRCFTDHLTDKGKLLITFNNNDMRAWTALIASLQNNGFVCQRVFYQIPAVISSKAQMSLKSSYISDVYSVYVLCPGAKMTRDCSSLLSHLRFIANARNGIIPRTVLDREFIISWLRNNIDHNMLEEKDDIIEGIFDFSPKEGMYTLKDEFREETEQLKDAVVSAMNELLNIRSYTILESYIKVCSKCERFGTMELAEFKNYITDFFIDNGKVYKYTQLSIFDMS